MGCSCPETNWFDGKGHDPGCLFCEPKSAGVAQVAVRLPRKQEVASSSDAASPSSDKFEQVSRCCK